ncbi:hypothetical protein OAI05_03875 [Planktomarina temperata]|nr:hypothetical protein [Planktomarina temperata]
MLELIIGQRNGGDGSGHSSVLQHWSKWAQTGRSLRSAPMIAKRTNRPFVFRTLLAQHFLANAGLVLLQRSVCRHSSHSRALF